jgi:glycosyltransferase A (GT-A) superfamily protein (DUF2064 family)
MQHSNAIVLFFRPIVLDRTKFDGIYAPLPWTELDALFSAIFDDTVEKLSRVPKTDVIIFRDHTEWSDEFVNVFLKSVKVGEIQGNAFPEQLHHALEQVLSAGYKRVIVFFENHPLISTTIVEHVFELLDTEDACTVIGQFTNNTLFFVGLRHELVDVFEQFSENDCFTPETLLTRLCQRETTVFQVNTLYPLDSTNGLKKLEQELQEYELKKHEIPKRTFSAFRNLEKKYRMKRIPV